MKAFILLLLSCAYLLGGETLVHLKSGETNIVSYGLYCVVSDSRTNTLPGTDLMLIIRNIGAKAIGTDVSVKDVSLRDAKGQEAKIWRATSSLSGIGFGQVAVIHVYVAKPESPQPWTLRFKSKESMASVDLTITDIEPRKK